MSVAVSKEFVEKIVGTEEKRKYVKCWGVDDYRKYSPGEHLVDLFLETAKPADGATLVDWGCGTGRAAKRLSEAGMDVTMLDFADNCLDSDVKEALSDNLRFIEQDLSEPGLNYPSEYGFCTDMLEHIPEEDIDTVLDNILNNSQHVFFQISTVPDGFGAHPQIVKDGEREHLHLTVWDYQKWLRKFVEKSVVIHHSNDLQDSVIFYVSGYGSFDLNRLPVAVNVPIEQREKNMEAIAALGYPSMQSHEAQDVEVMILAGGPSLADFEDEIKEKREAGMPMVTVNGTYNWAIERGLAPSLQLVIDGKKHNRRFTREAPGLTDETRYLIASQCDPSVFDGLPKDRTWVWHVSEESSVGKHFGEKFKDWWPIAGGTTVTTRSFQALQFLGFSKFHVYGFDSCIRDGEHHAYPQDENDGQPYAEITVAKGTDHEKTFKCEKWMIAQAKDFEKMSGTVLRNCQMIVYGDGLIAHYLKAGAEAAQIELVNT